MKDELINSAKKNAMTLLDLTAYSQSEFETHSSYQRHIKLCHGKITNGLANEVQLNLARHCLRGRYREGGNIFDFKCK